MDVGSFLSGFGNAVGSTFNSINQSKSLSQQGQFQQKMYEQNARLSRMASTQATIDGDLKANQIGMRTRQTIGNERASFAGQGVNVASGSASDVQASTAAVGAMDQLTVKNNAWRQAWGFQVQANNYDLQGKLAGIAGDYGAKTSLLTGGMNALSYLGGGKGQGGIPSLFGGGSGSSGFDTSESTTWAGPDVGAGDAGGSGDGLDSAMMLLA